jgi:hypothetical protein
MPSPDRQAGLYRMDTNEAILLIYTYGLMQEETNAVIAE